MQEIKKLLHLEILLINNGLEKYARLLKLFNLTTPVYIVVFHELFFQQLV